MNLGKLGQALTAREIFDLIQDDLEQVEKKITVESVASVDAVTAIGQYLQSAGGKRCAPPCSCSPPNWSVTVDPRRSNWAPSSN